MWWSNIIFINLENYKPKRCKFRGKKIIIRILASLISRSRECRCLTVIGTKRYSLKERKTLDSNGRTIPKKDTRSVSNNLLLKNKSIDFDWCLKAKLYSYFNRIWNKTIENFCHWVKLNLLWFFWIIPFDNLSTFLQKLSHK